MSEIKNILFHSLQRFDKKDADDLQKHIFDYLKENLVPGIMGNSSGKVDAADIAQTYTAATDTYTTTAPFDWLSGDGRFCTAASGIVYDASAVRTYHQNYLSANASLDGADTWYVWARPTESEEENESREFFSPIDNAAENRNVNTRNITRTILRAGTTKPDNSVGWARVGKFTFVAVVINNIRRLGDGTVSAIQPSDYMSFGLQSIRTPGTAGIQTITYALEEAMRKILSDGTEDPTGTPSTQPGSTPTMSLEGLTKYVREQTYSKRAHIVLRLSPNPAWPTNQEVDFSNLTNVAPYLAPTITEDYRRLGFASAILPHTFDGRRFLIPLDGTYYSNLLNEYGIGTNQLQDVNVIVQYPDNATPENQDEYSNPLIPDKTFITGRQDSQMAGHLITTYGNNGSWQGVSEFDYTTLVDGVQYSGQQGLGLFTPLCVGYDATLDTRGTPNFHQEIVPKFIDYNRTSGTELDGNFTTGVARYATVPTIEIQIIVKG